MDNENLKRLSEINEEVAQETEKSLIYMGLPSKIFLPTEVKSLGSKIAKIYNKKYFSTKEKFEISNFEDVVAIAYKQYWTACHSAAHFVRLTFISKGYKSLNETALFDRPSYARSDCFARKGANCESWY